MSDTQSNLIEVIITEVTDTHYVCIEVTPIETYSLSKDSAKPFIFKVGDVLRACKLNDITKA